VEVTVTEIHEYPLRPVGFVEPLFATPESRHEIAEHLLGAPWLSRASEMRVKSGSGAAAHTAEEPIRIQRHADGRVEVLRPGARRCSWRRRRVLEVLARWREVSRWWSDDDKIDRLVFRVRVAGHSPFEGGVVDLALDRSGARSGNRSGGWTLTGIVD
jgi:hypothetical protein